MRSVLLLFAFFFSFCLAANAQTSKSATTGSNANPDAPVNISEPGLRPSQPASYSATPLPDAQKGQFYVKDDKPAASDGTPIQPISPEVLDAIKKLQAKKDAEMRAGSSPKTASQPQAPASGKAVRINQQK